MRFDFFVLVLGVLSVADFARSARGRGNGEENSIGGKHASLAFAAGKPTRNDAYPLTPPIVTDKGVNYRIGVIADLDKYSKRKDGSGKLFSYFKKGHLIVDYDHEDSKNSKVEIEWDEEAPEVLEGALSYNGRGMELSELVTFNNEIISADDRTGVVYRLLGGPNPIPWVILMDGNGTSTRAFKCEWGTVKDDNLWIGSHGREWTVSKGYTSWVKSITPDGGVKHMDWTARYEKMRDAVNIHFPGYLMHEAGGWSDIHQKWMFLPRHASVDVYEENADQLKGTNLMITTDEDFEDIEVQRVGDAVPRHGFSSFKWVPGTDDKLVLGLKAEEVGKVTASYVMVFDMEGNILLDETKIADNKYEGIEFI